MTMNACTKSWKTKASWGIDCMHPEFIVVIRSIFPPKTRWKMVQKWTFFRVTASWGLWTRYHSSAHVFFLTFLKANFHTFRAVNTANETDSRLATQSDFIGKSHPPLFSHEISLEISIISWHTKSMFIIRLHVCLYAVLSIISCLFLYNTRNLYF